MPTLLGMLAGDAEIELLLADEAMLAAMLRVEAALAEAEAEAGLIGRDAAAAIVAGIGRFTPDWADLAAGMARDGVVVPAMVRQLRSVVEHPHASDIHRGATSQDIVDTALMLQLAEILPIYVDRITEIESALAHLGEKYGTQSLMAHTRMQAALPFTVGDKLRTWTESLERHRAALVDLRAKALAIQLGGPIGDRSSFDGHGDAIAEVLGRRLGLASVPSWHSSRDRVVAIGNRIAVLAGSLGKIGADIALLAQTEVAAITVKGAGTSSAMSHKANPVSAELLVALAHHAAGLVSGLHHAMVHEGERSGAAWTLEWLTMSPLLVTTGASLRAAMVLCSSIEFTASLHE